MKLPHALQISSLLLFCAVFSLGTASDGRASDGLCAEAPAATALPIATWGAARAFPYLHLQGGLELTYLGMFSPDALYHATSRASANTGSAPGEEIRPLGSQSQGGPTGEIPESMRAYVERVVDDYEPPAHAQVSAKSHSQLGAMTRQFLAFAYGHPSVILAPVHVATDSQQRVIISDPAGKAVHSLDPRGKTSFRIVSGPDRFLRRPVGVTVDSSDNIYVADSERGMVAVFDRNGQFIRLLGSYHGEPQFAAPNDIAFEPKSGHLYLSDTPRNIVVVMDLEGHILAQLGRLHNGTGELDFDHPTEICVSQGQVYVLDRMGTRLHVLYPSGRLVRKFELRASVNAKDKSETGLGVDRQGKIFVSSGTQSSIKVYSAEGRLLASFGRSGTRVGEFAAPGGLWIDSSDRLYVADSGNGRVQMFQLKAGP